jgi:Na+-driven multidrug efflux pump
MTKLAIPAAGERLFMRFGQVLYFGMIVRMGVEAYAAHNIAGTVTTFAYTIGNGFATAATALIGRSIGEGSLDKANQYRFWTYLYSAISMTIATIILSSTSPWWGLLYTHDHNVIRLLTIVIGIDIISQPFLAAVLVDTSAIQTGGNTIYPMVVTGIGMWGIRTLGVYLFGVVAGFGLPAVWACIAADNAFRASMFWLYRRKRHWVKPITSEIGRTSS